MLNITIDPVTDPGFVEILPEGRGSPLCCESDNPMEKMGQLKTSTSQALSLF